MLEDASQVLLRNTDAVIADIQVDSPLERVLHEHLQIDLFAQDSTGRAVLLNAWKVGV